MARVGDKKESEENRSSKKVMVAFSVNTLREVVRKINSLNISKEDIVSLGKDNGQFWIAYFSDKE